MKQHRLMAFLLLSAALLACAVLLFLLGGERLPAADVLGTLLFAMGLGLLALVAIRLAVFGARLDRFLRLLLAGHYEAGIRSRAGRRDELSTLEARAEQLAEQLRSYDRLRAQRVRVMRTLLDILQEVMSEPIMVYDPDGGGLECNSAFHLLFNLGRQVPLFGAVKAIEQNRRFCDLLGRAVETRRPVHGAGVPLRMRPGERDREIDLRMVPIRDGEGAVRSVLILVDREKDSGLGGRPPGEPE